MSILKEFAAKQESLCKATKLDYLQKLDDINDKMLKRNADIDRLVAIVSGDASPDSLRNEEKEELERLRNERNSTITKSKSLEIEVKALTEELEKDRKTMYEMEEMINELRTCRSCGSVREDIT